MEIEHPRIPYFPIVNISTIDTRDTPSLHPHHRRTLFHPHHHPSLQIPIFTLLPTNDTHPSRLPQPLLHIKHLLRLSPPPGPTRAPRRPLHRRLLHPVRHPPPLLYLGIRRHARHVFVEGVADVFEACEEGWAGGKGEEYGVCGWTGLGLYPLTRMKWEGRG